MDLVCLGSSLEDEDLPLVFLERLHLFRERVEKVIKTPLPTMVNLSVSPRAAEHLQQHWPVTTIGNLEQAPVPNVRCCARCGGVEAGVETEAARDQNMRCELQPSSSVVLLVMPLILLLAVLWANPVGGASLGFSLLSQFSQLVHGLSSEVITSVWDMAGSAYTAMEATVEKWSSLLSW